MFAHPEILVSKWQVHVWFPLTVGTASCEGHYWSHFPDQKRSLEIIELTLLQNAARNVNLGPWGYKVHTPPLLC